MLAMRAGIVASVLLSLSMALILLGLLGSEGSEIFAQNSSPVRRTLTFCLRHHITTNGYCDRVRPPPFHIQL